ncbi:hypothetical protein [Terriglobus aquaticus]|uniref:Uncharacterized protein n=2 Tax=Terriglobus aquaticus TaxID=940139 RepID=A0ABW9KPQ8_9BACT
MNIRAAAWLTLALISVSCAMPAHAQTFLLPLDSDGSGQQSTPAAKKPTPIGTISVGYAYLWADQGGYHRNLNGWLAKPTFNLANGWAVYADASNYYGANRKGSVNAHTYTLGVSKEILPKPKLKPALFLQMGDSRNSNAGSVVNAYALLTGINVTTPLTKWVSLSIIPAEYVYTHPDGENRNSYNAKVALVFPFGKKKG